MENQNYTIKDIARMAGVSAGTVDRVLHNRGDVSLSSKEKVQKVLDEINYQPNVFAIGLASKKKYTFSCVVPFYAEHDYWHSIVLGLERAQRELTPFNVSVNYLFYKHGDKDSFQQACKQAEEVSTDAVMIAPNFREETLVLLRTLDQKQVPYLFIDFNIGQSNALMYIGQNSFQSGYIAAKILMRTYVKGQELVLFLNQTKSNPSQIQMQRRLEGFMQYIAEEQDKLVIHDVILDKANPEENKAVLDAFFKEHPQAVLGAVFNSRVYQVAKYLQEAGRKMDGLIGYDLLPENVRFLKSGEVSYLIGQRPVLQSYYAMKRLCDHVVFKRPVESVKYMPIDILNKENIDFYFEFE